MRYSHSNLTQYTQYQSASHQLSINSIAIQNAEGQINCISFIITWNTYSLTLIFWSCLTAKLFLNYISHRMCKFCCLPVFKIFFVRNSSKYLDSLKLWVPESHSGYCTSSTRRPSIFQRISFKSPRSRYTSIDALWRQLSASALTP